jgi:adenine-specific DNA-methyltransferase
VPHITLKSSATNEEIDVIHANWQEQLDPLHAKINRAAKQKWEEWEVPRELLPDSKGLRDLSSLHAKWWKSGRDWR